MGLAWSNHDSSLLLSCAKDMRTICWDVQSTEIVCELTNSQNWSFDAQVCVVQNCVAWQSMCDTRLISLISSKRVPVLSYAPKLGTPRTPLKINHRFVCI